jgi:hypothetical protein
MPMPGCTSTTSLLRKCSATALSQFTTGTSATPAIKLVCNLLLAQLVAIETGLDDKRQTEGIILIVY